jgi:hypothetical protein
MFTEKFKCSRCKEKDYRTAGHWRGKDDNICRNCRQKEAQQKLLEAMTRYHDRASTLTPTLLLTREVDLLRHCLLNDIKPTKTQYYNLFADILEGKELVTNRRRRRI